VPGWLARPLIGGLFMEMMTTARGMSNAKAKRELDWIPAHPTWREGFREIAAGERGPAQGRAQG
jgi:hypothetical protein